VTDGLLQEVRHQAQTYVKTVADRLRAGPLAESQVTLTSGIDVKTDVAGTIVRLAEHAENAEQTCCLSNFGSFLPPHNFSSNCLRSAYRGDRHYPI
jgi:hypothetical protein